MRTMAIALAGVLLCAALITGTAAAQTQPAGGQYPTVSSLKPFSAEANYMSLPGYLRYLVFQQANQWLTYAEATRIVSQQQGM